MDSEDNVALFDMDESLAAYTDTMLRDLASLQSPNEERITAENIWKMDRHPHIAKRMSLIKSQPDWWFNLPPLENGRLVLEICRRIGFDIAVLTKGPQNHAGAWSEKLRWCQKWLSRDIDVTITFKKQRVYGKVLYDDYPEYMAEWLKRRPRGLGIMPVTPANRNFVHPNVVMYNGPEDLAYIENCLVKARDRESGQPLILEKR